MPLFSENVAGCFSAGVRVWTDAGPKPIEQIQVGDLVLSQPEAGGEKQYKRVVRTFVHENKTIRKIVYKVVENNRLFVLYATNNHPFWVVEESSLWEEKENGDDLEVINSSLLGWTQAEDLEVNDHLIQLQDGAYARVLSNEPVYKTNKLGVGWARNSQWSESGTVVNHLNGEVLADDVFEDFVFTRSADPLLEIKVYNFEVEDFHTYYVGGGGVWVHNANCAGQPINS